MFVSPIQITSEGTMSGITTFDKLVRTATEVFEDSEESLHDAALQVVDYLKDKEPKNLKKIFLEIAQKELSFEVGDVIDQKPLSWLYIFGETVASCLVKRLLSNPQLAAENKKRPN